MLASIEMPMYLISISKELESIPKYQKVVSILDQLNRSVDALMLNSVSEFSLSAINTDEQMRALLQYFPEVFSADEGLQGACGIVDSSRKKVEDSTAQFNHCFEQAAYNLIPNLNKINDSIVQLNEYKEININTFVKDIGKTIKETTETIKQNGIDDLRTCLSSQFDSLESYLSEQFDALKALVPDLNDSDGVAAGEESNEQPADDSNADKVVGSDEAEIVDIVPTNETDTSEATYDQQSGSEPEVISQDTDDQQAIKSQPDQYVSAENTNATKAVEKEAEETKPTQITADVAKPAQSTEISN